MQFFVHYDHPIPKYGNRLTLQPLQPKDFLLILAEPANPELLLSV
jgi:hypothetical protein